MHISTYSRYIVDYRPIMGMWTIYGLFLFNGIDIRLHSQCNCTMGSKQKGCGIIDNLQELQEQLRQVHHRMELDEQNGLGWATEDVHEAGELMSRIFEILLESVGSD